MSPSRLYDVFLRLPPATAILLLSALFATTEGHALPRQTKTAEYYELNVSAWQPLPTEAPISPLELLRRQEENTICGYLGGDSALPATCSAGSHCVLDSDNGVVGCCPNGGTCTTGVFTGCVDYNSGAQTEANPYVYTCQGSDVCYKNEFDGGYFQYGCGTASDLATTVQTTASGITNSLTLDRSSVALTGSPTSLSEPTSINPSTGTRSYTRSTSSSKSSTLSSESSSSSTSSSTSTISSPSSSSQASSTNPPTSSGTTDAGSLTSSPSPTVAPATGQHFNRTGAIVGGTVGGVVVLIALAATLIFCLRKRRGNNRQGPGPAPGPAPTTEYLSPMRSHGAAFAPLPTWQEDESQQHYAPSNYSYPSSFNGYQQQDVGNVTSVSVGAGAAQLPRYNPAHVAGVGRGLAPVEEESIPDNTREIDEFSNGYNNAMGRINDEDIRPLTEDEAESRTGSESGSPSRGGGNRPLWQQNRRQSRNLMWM
ncbi:uncharacterized protein BCR38DRAFT_457396 [Pseudomassariella vexata]|uniref:Uncharacterized protein n=1 Tax=Pseudomassariella vexata TaxID=1141098 RepID=A0A1Y2E110_9PEZI|nr:uncharacterized protein BCR38DRAFT_457396 [Pseudomassariella vexata]ORY65167.1 hypothetical protein BCR38DRAFT_457396 [Pseudomassariella vexata]